MMPKIVNTEKVDKITNMMSESRTNAPSSFEELQIAGSHALCVFIAVIGIFWIAVLWWAFLIIPGCFRSKLKRIDQAQTVKYRDEKKKVKTLYNTWSSINFAILWLNLSAIIYCYITPRNCVLKSPEINSRSLFFWVAGWSYVLQLFENMSTASNRQKKSYSYVRSTASVLDEVARLIRGARPVIRWRARCFHMESDVGINGGIHTIVTHVKERIQVCNWWRISSVWKEGAFKFHQVTEKDVLEVNSPRVKITVQACAGDQVTRRNWENEFDKMKEEHRAGKHDEYSDFKELRRTSTCYLVDNCPSFCSSKIILRLGVILSKLLGLGPVYRVLLFFLLPEEHYVIEKNVYSSAPGEGATDPLRGEFSIWV